MNRIVGTIAILLALTALLLALLPRRQTRWIRHRIAALIYWQWRKMGLLSVEAYRLFWQQGNGKV